MLRRIFFGLSLFISIAMCLSLVVFPILEYDKNNIQRNNQEFINQYIEENKNGEIDEETLKREAIQIIIDSTSINLQLFGNVEGLIQNENGEWISLGIDYELRDFELDRLRSKGIKYRDLANGIKNQIKYDIELNNLLKNNFEITKKEKNNMFFAAWINPIPFIGIVILIALEFASAFLVIIRSIKGIMGKKKTKLLTISIFGCVMSFLLLILPKIVNKGITSNSLPNNYVGAFIGGIKGSNICYYCFFGFAICVIISIMTKFMKRVHN